jgi:hypothetical protein
MASLISLLFASPAPSQQTKSGGFAPSAKITLSVWGIRHGCLENIIRNLFTQFLPVTCRFYGRPTLSRYV